MADITKVTLAKEKDSGIEYYYPSSSSDIIEHQVKDTEEYTTVKRKLDELEDRVGDVNLQEVIDARVAISDGDTKIDLKARIDSDYSVLSNKLKKKICYLRNDNLIDGSISAKFASGEFKDESRIMIMFDIAKPEYSSSASTGNGRSLLVLDLLYKKNNDDYKISIIEFGYIYRNSDCQECITLTIDNNKWALYDYGSSTGGRSNLDLNIQVIADSVIDNDNCSYIIYGTDDIETVNGYIEDSIKPTLNCIPYSHLCASDNITTEPSPTEMTAASIGLRNTASGHCSAAIGYYNTSSGDYSSAIGYYNTSSGKYSFATGGKGSTRINGTLYDSNNIASGNYSAVIGKGNTSSGEASLTINSLNVSSINNGFVGGLFNESTGNNGNYGFIYGYNNKAWGENVTLGNDNNVKGRYGIILGSSNNIGTDEDVSTGTVSTIYTKYNIVFGRGNTSTTETGSINMGSTNTTSGSEWPVAIGSSNKASGDCSSAIGFKNTSSGEYATAAGFNNIVSGNHSFAIGGENNTTGFSNVAIGYGNKSSSDYTMAIGFNNEARNDGCSFGFKNTISGSNKFACLFTLGAENEVSDNSNTIDSISVAIGSSNIISEANSYTLGMYNTVTGSESIAIGYGVLYGNSVEYNTVNGTNSISIGKNTIDGDHSYSIGYRNIVSGEYSYAIGGSSTYQNANIISESSERSYSIGDYNTITNGSSAFAIGTHSIVSGENSLAIGFGRFVQGGSYLSGGTIKNTAEDHSIAFGYGNESSGYRSIAIGSENTTYNRASMAVGVNNGSEGECSFTFGMQNKASGNYSIAIGVTGAEPWDHTNDDHGFLYKDRLNIASGAYSIAIGNKNKSSGDDSIAIGGTNEANNRYAMAIGFSNKIGKNSIGIGLSNTTDNSEIAIGWNNDFRSSDTYEPLYSTNIGYNNYIGDNSSNGNTCKGAAIVGYGCECVNTGCFVCGTYNRITTAFDLTTIRRIDIADTTVGDSFVVGNGTSDQLTSHDNGVTWHKFDTSNAFRITVTGETYANGAYNNSGADYAEFVKEWYDGNPDNEDRVGYMVTIGEDGKLHKANEGDYIIGITSGNPSIIGNADEDYYWRYERDKFNRIIISDEEILHLKQDENGNTILDEDGNPVTETIIIRGKKISPNYDPDTPYISRSQRPEWDYVGMRGIVPCRDDGTCVARGFCKCGNNGIATKAETRGFDTYYVIERIDEETISVEVR